MAFENSAHDQQLKYWQCSLEKFVIQQLQKV